MEMNKQQEKEIFALLEKKEDLNKEEKRLNDEKTKLMRRGEEINRAICSHLGIEIGSMITNPDTWEFGVKKDGSLKIYIVTSINAYGVTLYPQKKDGKVAQVGYQRRAVEFFIKDKRTKIIGNIYK